MSRLKKLINCLKSQPKMLKIPGTRGARPDPEISLNEHSGRWYATGIDPFDTTGDYACQRLRRDYFNPGIEAKFKMTASDRIYTIGSCFARGIENALLGRGMQVESAASEFDVFPRVSDKVTPLGFTNKYNTRSILNELTWALDPETPFPDKSLVQLDDSLCIDPHVNPTLKLANDDETMQRRAIISEVTRRITRCKVIVITLGLVEVWKDENSGEYLNITPTKKMMELHPGRFSFHKIGFQENLDNLESIYNLITKHCLDDVQVVVTVSPVALMATFTGNDVVTANTYSKSTLRSVAQEWSELHSNVHYFPSYEIVMNSNREIAWIDDFRHVDGHIVQFIMDIFIKAYVQTDAG